MILSSSTFHSNIILAFIQSNYHTFQVSIYWNITFPKNRSAITLWIILILEIIIVIAVSGFRQGLEMELCLNIVNGGTTRKR